MRRAAQSCRTGRAPSCADDFEGPACPADLSSWSAPQAGKGYVLGVAANRVFRSWGKKQLVGGTAAAIAQSQPEKAWHRLSSGDGTKGPRLHDWAYLELADLEAGEYNDDLAGDWTRGL